MEDTQKLASMPVGRLVAQMSAHTTLALLLYSVYNLTDTLFIARGVGEHAAGAVALTAPLMLALNAVSTTVGAGGASIISRTLGKNDPQRAAKAAAGAFSLFWGAALLVTFLGLVFLEPLLGLLGADAALLPYARPYASIILAGAVTSTGFSALIRAEGNTRFSLCIWAIPVLLNLLLDALFIFGLGMGTAGAALATVLAQAASMGMSIYFFFFKQARPYRIRAADFRPRPAQWREMLAIGFPSLVQQLSSGVVLVLLNRLVAGAGGADAVAAFSFAARVQAMAALPQTGVTQSVQPIVGYSYAKGDAPRLRKALRAGAALSILYGLGASLACVLLRRPLMGLFTSQPQILELGAAALLLLGLAIPLKGILPLAAACFQAMGRARLALLLPTLFFGCIQLPLLWLLGGQWGFAGVLWAGVLADLAGFATGCVALKFLYRENPSCKV